MANLRGDDRGVFAGTYRGFHVHYLNIGTWWGGAKWGWWAEDGRTCTAAESASALLRKIDAVLRAQALVEESQALRAGRIKGEFEAALCGHAMKGEADEA